MRGLTNNEYTYLRSWVVAEEGDAFFSDSAALAARSREEMGLVHRVHDGGDVYVVDTPPIGWKALRVEEVCRVAGVL